MYGYEHEEDYYYGYAPSPPPPRRFPSPRHIPNPHRRSAHLSPDPPFGSSLHRSRSYGNGPRPEINIYNYQDQVADQAQRLPVPAPMPPPPMAIPVYAPSPEIRGRQDARLTDELLAAEIAEMRFERLARSKSSHSRTRARSDVAAVHEHPAGPNYYKWQLEQLEKEKHDAEQRKYWEAKRKVEAEEADAERKRIIDAHDQELRERAARQKEEERRILEKVERDKKEAKEEERRILERHERERKEAKEREEQQWKEFEQKQRERHEEAERKEKEEKAKVDAIMLDRLLKAGYSLEQAEAMIDPKKAKKERKHKHESDITIIETGGGGGGGGVVMVPEHTHHVPVYAKIHKKYLDVQTLRYYQIPYEYDVVCASLSLHPPPFPPTMVRVIGKDWRY